MLMGFSCVLGLYGYLLGMLAMLGLLFGTKTFGVPIMRSGSSDNAQDDKDTFWRSAWTNMIKRPNELTGNQTRQKSKGAKNEAE